MISLIIPAYNEEAYLPTCLNSLANQKNKDFSIILINNASTDQTLKLMQEFANRKIIATIVVSEENIGKINALNNGLQYALKDCTIDTLAFSDADSYFDSNWSKQAVNISADFAYSTEMFVDVPELQLVPNFRKTLYEYTKMLYFTRKNLGGFMNLGNCLVNKNAFIKVGGFDSSWTKSLDTLLTIKLLKNGFVGNYFDGKVCFSPRRILENIDKWCLDRDIREFVNIYGQYVWKPVRNNPNYLTDIGIDQIQKTLEVKSERLYKRLMLLTLYESKPLIKNKFLNFTKDILPSVSEYCKLIRTSSLNADIENNFLLKLNDE
jgi:glycosyltransferase involved in cell wall biosynthesis